jgi:hypothetical protein
MHTHTGQLLTNHKGQKLEDSLCLVLGGVIGGGRRDDLLAQILGGNLREGLVQNMQRIETERTK